MPADPNSILIVRLGSMGDIVHTLPAAGALEQAFPHATLGWVVEERWAELLCTLPTARSGPRSPQRPLPHRIHAVNTARWRQAPFSAQTGMEIAATLSELRAPRYEIAADFQGAARSALVARWSGAPVVYGWAQARENIASMLYTRQVLARGVHIVEQNLSLAEAITGRPQKPPSVTLPQDTAADEKWDRWLRDRGLTRYLLLNPGAGWGAKRWPAERYGMVARELAREGLRSLINFGPGEQELVGAVEAASGGAAEAISGSLSQLIAITRRARLFIGGDTGPLHLAAALGVPVVAIFGPTNPARNGPFGAPSVVLRSPSSATSHRRLAPPDPGLLEISVQQVVGAARELLRSRLG
jgi:heptosyltransferase-1